MTSKRPILATAAALLALTATACSSSDDTTTANTSSVVTQQAAASSETTTQTAAPEADLRAAVTAAYADGSTSMKQAVTPECATKIDGWWELYDYAGDLHILDITIDGDDATVTTRIEGQDASTDHWTNTSDGWRLTC